MNHSANPSIHPRLPLLASRRSFGSVIGCIQSYRSNLCRNRFWETCENIPKWCWSGYAWGGSADHLPVFWYLWIHSMNNWSSTGWNRTFVASNSNTESSKIDVQQSTKKRWKFKILMCQLHWNCAEPEGFVRLTIRLIAHKETKPNQFRDFIYQMMSNV